MAVVALLLAGCSARTTGATNITSQSATLTASGDCNGSSTPCQWYWRWGPHGSGYTAQTGSMGTVPVNWSGSVSYTASGLEPATAYDYQICGYAQGAWQKCYGPDGTENSYGQFTTGQPSNYFWYQSTSTGGRIANDPDGNYTTTSPGAFYLLPSTYVQGRNGVDAPTSSPDRCTTNGTGRMETYSAFGVDGFSTGLAVPSSSYGITTNNQNANNPVCQAKGSAWGFYMGQPPGDPPNTCATECNMQHSVSFDTCNQDARFNCRPWSASKFGTSARVILASNYNAYTACTVVSYCPSSPGHPGGDYHAYMCMWLQDASKTPHPRLEYCVETWRDRAVTSVATGGVQRADAAANFNESTTLAGPPGDQWVISWTRAAPGTAYATKCTVTAMCPLSSSDTTLNSAFGSRSYAVTISRSQLALVAKDAIALGKNYSTNPSDYELVGIENGNEGSGYGALGSNVNGLTVATAY
ncbi:MAG TPA: hypothetical protein VJT75_14715 [Thermoleophilaceae bacterium]|nr:hypothetical protein [Thermoleophilaceae bacterium]